MLTHRVSNILIRNRLLIAILTFGFCVSAFADQSDMEVFRRAEALINSGDEDAVAYATGMLVGLTKKDDPLSEAASTLGLIFGLGIGVTPNASEAFKWHSVAAKLGNSVSTREVGIAYLLGSGIEIDQRKGLSLLLAAADMGEPTAMIQAAQVYAVGNVVEQDVVQSARLYLLAVATMQEKPEMYGDELVAIVASLYGTMISQTDCANLGINQCSTIVASEKPRLKL